LAGAPIAWVLVAVSGTALVAGTLLLYDGLARGPVTVVAPIVGAYPVAQYRSQPGSRRATERPGVGCYGGRVDQRGAGRS
jgi:hypothetical protein